MRAPFPLSAALLAASAPAAVAAQAPWLAEPQPPQLQLAWECVYDHGIIAGDRFTSFAATGLL